MVANVGQSVSPKRLVRVLETQVNESDTSAYGVGEQRERNHRYYTLQPLGNERKGRSHYISPDVLDAVESKKALFSETFLSSRQVAQFVDCPYPNEGEAKTAYVNRTFKRNHHATLFRDAWHDAFVAKRCVFMVDWHDDEKELVLNLPGVPAPVVAQQLQGVDIVEIDDSDVTYQVMPGIQGSVQIMSGRLRVMVPDGYVKIDLVQPERYFRDPEATYPCDSMWVTVQEDVSRGALVDLGFDYDQVMRLSQEYRFRSDEEDAARKRHDASWTRRRQTNRVDEQELVSYFRTRTWLEWDDEVFADLNLDFQPQPGMALYEIHWSQGEILTRDGGVDEFGEPAGPVAAIKVVEEMNVFEWSEMKISHAENGVCTSDVVSHTQKTTSQLKRLIIDNQEMQNSTRMLAKLGQLKNPRDLLDNAIGSVLWTQGELANTAMPLPTPELSQMTFQTLQMLKQDSEERSGISGLAKGMNSDAVKYQNADNMIERLTTAGQRRVTMQARDFALTCLVPMCKYITTLAKRHDTSREMMESKGQPLPIAPQSWQEDDTEMEVRVALTPEENKAFAQQLLTMHSIIGQDPQMQLSYGASQKHALFDMVYELIGISDTSDLMLSPKSPEYQQAVMGQQQMAQQQQAQNQQMQQFQMGLLQSGDQREWAKFQWDQVDDMQDNLREDYKARTDNYEARVTAADKGVTING